MLNLPRVPWEGGSSYYANFPRSAGYADPNVFPIGVWWASFDSDANVKWDKAHGVNTYIQFNPNSPGSFVGANGMYYINDAPMAGSPENDPAWVGWWLDDEVDGRYSATEGPGIIQSEIDAQSGHCSTGTKCWADYANYTGFVTSDHSSDGYQALAERYVNMYDGPVSVDGYYYTDPSCDDPNRVDNQISAPDAAHCRTGAAYGNFIKNLRTRDAADGKLKPLWGFIENGAPTGSGIYITPNQMSGAVWSTITNEGRGFVWFNQSFSGNCQSGNVIRDAQAQPSGCNATRVEAMKTIDAEVQSFAPILNTQSYKWTFGPGMDTMLKVKDGSAYIFATVGLNADPGQRTFTLPSGISGTSVGVVGESRSLQISGGKFTDSFAAEYTHHVYKITI